MIGTTPMTPKEISDPNVTWQAKAAAWLASQGVSTVLLFAIVVGVWRELPNLVNQVQSGYKVNADQLERSALIYKATTDKLMQQLLDDRALMLELAREQKRALEQIKAKP